MSSREYYYWKLRILVVEDNEFIRVTVVKILKNIGVRTIYEASDGKEALNQATTYKPNLAICDIEMTPMSGLEFLKTVRSATVSADPEMPILFLTSHTESATVLEAKRLGIDAFLVKPVSMTKLKERLDWVIEHRPNLGATEPRA